MLFERAQQGSVLVEQGGSPARRHGRSLGRWSDVGIDHSSASHARRIMTCTATGQDYAGSHAGNRQLLPAGDAELCS